MDREQVKAEMEIAQLMVEHNSKLRQQLNKTSSSAAANDDSDGTRDDSEPKPTPAPETKAPPLLGCRKLELVGYLEGLVPVRSWMEDSSNALPVYQRNRCVM
jgi:hypothetical protein